MLTCCDAGCGDRGVGCGDSCCVVQFLFSDKIISNDNIGHVVHAVSMLKSFN